MNDAHDTTDDRITVPLAEEVLEPRVVERERGRVRIRTRVETEPVQEEVTLRQESVEVEHIPRNEVVSERREPWHEDGALLVPVYEEVPVTELRLVLREVVRVRVVESSETATVEGEIRREVAEVEGDEE